MHYGVYYEDKKEMAKKLKAEILKIEPKENSNIIISAHNGVVRTTGIFDRIDSKYVSLKILKMIS